MAETLAHGLMTPEEARLVYDLRPARDVASAGGISQALAEHGIAHINMPLTPDDFVGLTSDFDDCIGEFGDLLADTYYVLDHRPDNLAGYVRKERKVNQAGRQIEDPKSLIHFTEAAYERWEEQFQHAPKMLRDFLKAGFEVQNILTAIASANVRELEETHPNISQLYFPDEVPYSTTYLRVLSYDGYAPDEAMGDVAKPHYDRSGLTIQAHADADGFWGAHDGPQGQRIPYATGTGEAYCFVGQEHKKVYGADSPLEPLWHGVDRVVLPEAVRMPVRHSVILFVDAPLVDHGIQNHETVPYLVEQPRHEELAG